jgi:glycerol-1-phosphate dehydrogenase [NAD(P)+]
MELPRLVVTGGEIIAETGKLLEDLELGKKTTVISGPVVRNGMEKPLLSSLYAYDYSAAWETIEAATFEEAERVASVAKKSKSNFFIGVGGGKSIDVAKLASFNSKIPFVSVPTSASHDGISSPFASVKGMDRPYSIVAKPPVAIIADTSVILKAPMNLMVSGCGDLVSKKTAVKDWELAHEKVHEYYGRYSASLALLSANLIIEEANLISSKVEDSIRVVVEALISSGVAAGIAGSSRPCSGSEHLFSHSMDIVAPGKGLHGEKCGLGTIMMAKLHGIDFQQIRTALETIGAPTKAKQIGATTDEIVKALVLARTIRRDRYTILDEVELDEQSARKLAQETGVV